MNTKLKTSIAVTAATLFASGCHTIGYDKYNDAEKQSVSCFGVNGCKAQGSCATHLNACAGQNSCKGKGIKQMPNRKSCEAQGGSVYESI